MKNIMFSSEGSSLVLALLASVVFLTSCYVYNKDILEGSNKPNKVGWGLFMFITFINASSYLTMTSDLVKGLMAFTDLSTCVIIFSILFFKGKWEWPKLTEWLAILCSLIAIAVWFSFRAMYGNLSLQIAYLLAFYITLKNAYDGKESVLPWFIASAGMFLSIIVVLVRWTNNWEDLCNPIIAFGLHLATGIIALVRNKTLNS